MGSLLIQGGNWDIRGLLHTIGWPWMAGFVIVFVSSGVLVYFELRKPRDNSAAGGKGAVEPAEQAAMRAVTPAAVGPGGRVPAALPASVLRGNGYSPPTDVKLGKVVTKKDAAVVSVSYKLNGAPRSAVLTLRQDKETTAVVFHGWHIVGGVFPGKVRLVFRVKTNRGNDDETGGFSSGGAGAAIIDNVVVTGAVSGSLLNNGFEAAGDIDNNPATPATSAWKSTGKPPQAWFHIHNIQGTTPYATAAPFTDPCGAITAQVRLCNMGGNVLSPGWHDNPKGADATGGPSVRRSSRLRARS